MRCGCEVTGGEGSLYKGSGGFQVFYRSDSRLARRLVSISSSCLCARFGGPLCLDEALFDEELFEFAVLVHLEGNVAPPDELAADVQLRDRRPRTVRVESSQREECLKKERERRWRRRTCTL